MSRKKGRQFALRAIRPPLGMNELDGLIGRHIVRIYIGEKLPPVTRCIVNK